jgi:hypothetical protein
MALTKEQAIEVAKSVVAKGFKDGLSEDDIKGNMFSSGIPFSMINNLFKSTAIELGLIVDPKVLQTAIDSEVSASEWHEGMTWKEFDSFCEGILSEVEGATKAKIVAAAKKYCKENEIPVPEETKEKASRAKGGKAADAVVALFNKIQKPTKQELYEALLPCVKGPENAVYYVNQYYALAFALGNSIALAKAAADTKDQTFGPEVEAEEEEEADEE